MTCHVVPDPASAATLFVCGRGRGRRAKQCACGRDATHACDGRVRTPSNRTRACNAPLCDACATPVDDTHDQCAACVAAAAPDDAPEGALVAYADGSGTVAWQPCGAGVVVFDGARVVVEASRHLGPGTNNHAELSALRVAMAITDAAGLRERLLLIRSDSSYAIGAITSGREPLPDAPNAKLIFQARAQLAKRAASGGGVDFEHVRGHAGVWGNERADALAGLGRLRVPPPKGPPGRPRVAITANRGLTPWDHRTIDDAMRFLARDLDAAELRFGGARGGDTEALRAAAKYRDPARTRFVVIVPDTLAAQPPEAREAITACLLPGVDFLVERRQAITKADGWDAMRARNVALVHVATHVVGFWDGVKQNSGTYSCLAAAARLGRPLWVVPIEGADR